MVFRNSGGPFWAAISGIIMTDTAEFGYSQQEPSDTASEYNTDVFVIEQQLGQLRTVVVVQVIAVYNEGLNPVGTVDVQPLVNYTDGIENGKPHGTIFGLPYFRLQGGSNAFIIDPAVGDVGIAVIVDRDISSVKANQAAINTAQLVGTVPTFNPGSSRDFDLADGIYIGGILNGTPKQYIQFDSLGNLNITVKTAVNIVAPGGLTVNGTPVVVP